MIHSTANLLPVLVVCLIYAILTAVSTIATLLLVKVPEHDAQVMRDIERMNYNHLRDIERMKQHENYNK